MHGGGDVGGDVVDVDWEGCKCVCIGAVLCMKVIVASSLAYVLPSWRLEK